MIIIFSPAKTFIETTIKHHDEPMFLNDAKKLMKSLKKLSITDIQKHMHVSLKVANETKSYYQAFGKQLTPAIYTYHGQAYKALNVRDFDDEMLKRLQERVYILSGLYGLIRPLDGISHYRLEMKDQTITNLYDFWRHKINQKLKKHDVIINLASKEYDHIIDHKLPMITIMFKQKFKDDYKMLSMEVKTMRGRMLNKLIKDDITQPQDIKSIVIDGYQYDPVLSNNHTYVFVKEINS